MSLTRAALIAAVFTSSCFALSAQVPAAPVPAAPPNEIATPSKLLRPSLDNVQQTMSAVRLDKWKKGSVRDEAGDNIAAIVRDIKTNLPPLLTTADASPQMVSKVLPVLRHIDALYDVVLRVNEAARVSGPADQVTQIDQAMSSLQKARLALDDSMQDSAALIEKKAADLQTALDAQAAVKCPAVATPVTPVCAPPAKKVRKKPVTPAAPAAQAPAASAPKPSN